MNEDASQSTELKGGESSLDLYGSDTLLPASQEETSTKKEKSTVSETKTSQAKTPEKKEEKSFNQKYWWVYLLGAIAILIIITIILYLLADTCTEEEDPGLLCTVARTVETAVNIVADAIAGFFEYIYVAFAAFFAWLALGFTETIGKWFGKNPNPPTGGDGGIPGDHHPPDGGGGNHPSKPPRPGKP